MERKKDGAPALQAGRADGGDATAILAQMAAQLQELSDKLDGLIAQEPPEYMTVPQAAAHFGLGRDDVYAMVRAKVSPMPHQKRGNRRYVNVRKAGRWLEERDIA